MDMRARIRALAAQLEELRLLRNGPPGANDGPVEVWHRLDDNTRSLLRRNDPSVEMMELRWKDIDFHGQGKNRCERDGLLLGQCTSLRKLKITGLNRVSDSDENIARFELVLRGLARNRSIEELSLDGYGPEPVSDYYDGHLCMADTFSILASFFEHNRKLYRLELDFPGVMYVEGHKQLLPALEKCSSLREFKLQCDKHDVDEYGGEILTALKNGKGKLRKLFLKECFGSWNGCAELGDLIQNSTLEELDLSENEIDDEGATLLGRILSGKTTLKILRLGSMYGGDDGETPSITPAGVTALFSCLKSPNCALEELDVRCDGIDDDSSLTLVESLADNKKLKVLNFRGHTTLSPNGWHNFFTKLLQGPNSVLEHLDVSGCYCVDEEWESFVDNGIASTLADSLAENRSLTTLNLVDFDSIDVDGLRTFMSAVHNILYNDESLATVISSNHTLSHVFLGSLGKVRYLDRHTIIRALPITGDFGPLLRLNLTNNKAEIVRQKVLRYYNSDNPNVDEFIDADWIQVVPHAMAWAGRDDLGLTLLFRLIRRVPALFNVRKGELH